ncbi:MAG: Na+/H+ antiporter NhaC family protein [Candidatus Metalachnospira sp.]|nr:Na+/H+ antiporter NhaC family protein [Candidatus Metalachnospira sp.]
MNEGNNETNKIARGSALIPFAVFIVVYLGAGIILDSQGVDLAFYQFPSPVAALIGVVVAFIMFKGTVDEKFTIFAKGCGNENILTMCFIYLFAGAFAAVAKSMGGVDATVNLGLSIIPAKYITGGMFVISAFIAVATGTSVGTISAVGPIAVATADKAGLSLPLIIAAVIGGAMFGDNLSVISDTTIAATKTQGVEMKDKFRINFLIALPAAIITLVVLLFVGKPDNVVELGSLSYNFVKIIPYIVVLVFALIGFNVFLTLGAGVVLAGIIGIISGDFNILGFAQNIYTGFTGMFEIFLLSLIIGGLSELCAHYGGIQWMLEKINKLVKSKRSAQIGISSLVSLCDIATANNTIAIIIAGQPSREICEKYEVDPRKSASLLDIWSCVFQGILPYSAQVLIACGLTAGLVSPTQLLPLLWYPYLLGLFAIISLFVPFAEGVIKKNPWNFKTWSAEKNK